MVLEVPCFKSMDPVHVVNAYRAGFDGVMGVVCSNDDCKLQQGRDIAERQLGVLTDFLKKIDLLERFEYVELPPDVKASSSPSLKLSTTKLLRCLRQP